MSPPYQGARPRTLSKLERGARHGRAGPQSQAQPSLRKSPKVSVSTKTSKRCQGQGARSRRIERGRGWERENRGARRRR
eukprot:3588289-Pleurochrysis_carterae.AAC.1